MYGGGWKGIFVFTSAYALFCLAAATTCTSPNGSSLTCRGDAILGNGDTGSAELDTSKAFAWDGEVNIVFIIPSTKVRQVNLFFYNIPSSGIGLPPAELFWSNARPLNPDIPLSHVIVGNQDLSHDDRTLRNVSLVVTTDQNFDYRYFRIHFTFPAETSLIAWILLSEVQLCGEAVALPTTSITFLHPASMEPPVPPGPDIVVSAANLSCTVANEGSFQWQWTLPPGINLSRMWVADGTRTSIVEISQISAANTGDYTCQASFNGQSANASIISLRAIPPINLSAEPAGPTSIRIFWTPPDSGAIVVMYRINYLGEGAQDSPMHHGSVDIGTNETQHTLSDLQQGLWYTITMFAMPPYFPSTEAVRATLAMVRVKVVNATALLVSWDALRNTHHYTIYYSAFSPELFKVVDELTIVVPSTRASEVVVIRELTAGVEHQFQVTASLEVQGEVYESGKSILTKIEFDEAAFHLQMGPVSPCTTWSTDKAETIRTYIHSGIAKAISYHRNCSFPVEFIREGLFRCWKAPDEFSYRSAIVGTETHNATELVQFLEEWVVSEPALQVEQFELWVDTKCPVLISSLKMKVEGRCS